DNIVVTPEGNAKVLDFGLARLVQPSGELDLTKSLTETDVVVGTMPYMAPEQLMARPVDARADLYSFGVVLYELATGRSPYRERALAALVYEIANQPASSPREINPGLSPQLESVILRCLAKQPAQRYASARDVVADLREPQ